MAHVHSANVPSYLINIHPGYHAGSAAFMSNINDFNPQLALSQQMAACAACCWDYLVNQRNYNPVIGLNRVFFTTGQTSCMLNGPQGPSGRHSVIQTGLDVHMGNVGPRTTQGSVSFQLYLPPDVPSIDTMAIGVAINARIESISTNALRSGAQLSGCYFNYCDAVLIELCNVRSGRVSFCGSCSSQAPQPFVLAGTSSTLPKAVVEAIGHAVPASSSRGTTDEITAAMLEMQISNIETVVRALGDIDLLSKSRCYREGKFKLSIDFPDMGGSATAAEREKKKTFHRDMVRAEVVYSDDNFEVNFHSNLSIPDGDEEENGSEHSEFNDQFFDLISDITHWVERMMA